MELFAADGHDAGGCERVTGKSGMRPSVSSGVVEAGCKQIGAKLKRAGVGWTVAGANAIIALRRSKLSGRFEDFSERRAANAA